MSGEFSPDRERIRTKAPLMAWSWLAILLLPVGAAGLLLSEGTNSIFLLMTLTGAVALWVSVRRLSCRVYEVDGGLQERGLRSFHYLRWDEVQILQYESVPDKGGLYGYRVWLAGERLNVTFILEQEEFTGRFAGWERRCVRAIVVDCDAGALRGAAGRSAEELRECGRRLLLRRARRNSPVMAMMAAFVVASLGEAWESGNVAVLLVTAVAGLTLAGLALDLWRYRERIAVQVKQKSNTL